MRRVPYIFLALVTMPVIAWAGENDGDPSPGQTTRLPSKVYEMRLGREVTIRFQDESGRRVFCRGTYDEVDGASDQRFTWNECSQSN